MNLVEIPVLDLITSFLVSELLSLVVLINHASPWSMLLCRALTVTLVIFAVINVLKTQEKDFAELQNQVAELSERMVKANDKQTKRSTKALN